MSYGDSTTWNGTVPAASIVTHNIFWRKSSAVCNVGIG